MHDLMIHKPHVAFLFMRVFDAFFSMFEHAYLPVRFLDCAFARALLVMFPRNECAHFVVHVVVVVVVKVVKVVKVVCLRRESVSSIQFTREDYLDFWRNPWLLKLQDVLELQELISIGTSVARALGHWPWESRVNVVYLGVVVTEGVGVYVFAPFMYIYVISPCCYVPVVLLCRCVCLGLRARSY